MLYRGSSPKIRFVSGKLEMSDTKRLKPASAEETAAILTAAAGMGGGEEQMVDFNATHYGPLGLNGRFEQEDAIHFFAGGPEGGGGMFESEKRDIAKGADSLIQCMLSHGLQPGDTLLEYVAHLSLLGSLS